MCRGFCSCSCLAVPHEDQEDGMTAVKGRVDARKVLSGRVVIVLSLTVAWAPRGAEEVQVVIFL